MPLLTEFRELGFELSQLVKKEIEQIKSRSASNIENIKSETQKKIQQDLQNLESTLTQRIIMEANKKISDQINHSNLIILESKKKLLDTFIVHLGQNIKDKIKSNYPAYLKYLVRIIETNLHLFDSGCILYLNSKDLTEIQQSTDLLKRNPNLSVAQEPIETICGCKIHSKNGVLELNLTYESLVEKKYIEISRLVMATFPIFTVTVEDVSDYYQNTIKAPQSANNS